MCSRVIRHYRFQATETSSKVRVLQVTKEKNQLLMFNPNTMTSEMKLICAMPAMSALQSFSHLSPAGQPSLDIVAGHT
jgi:hypothetical protein